ncbi:hypothetical protein BV22DRAFT_1041805 [Leucogyrophana mollusca]|uniref:Uncharacterized protein n=1 Tax=Leucogyrophana mollusca TaxID=85980 RepID=A0ACB8AYL3_9AGAM|nr:hypothetical protein BV22DRAFT_1041805 [Leucogyrophana mollusca]
MSFALSDITGITAPSSGDASPFRPSEVKRVCELSSPSPLTSASSVDLCAARPGSTRDMVDCSRSSEPDASTARSMLALRAPAIVMSQSDVVRIQERRLTTPASSSLAMTLPASTDLSRLPTLATFGPTSYALAFRRGTSGSPSVPSMRLRKFWVPPIADDAVVSSNPKIQMEISALRSQRRVAGGGVASLGGGRLNSLAGLAIVSKVRAQWEHSS